MQFLKSILFAVCIFIVIFIPASEASDLNETEKRIASLEARLMEMEARLAETEKEPDIDSDESAARIAELEARLSEAEQETKKLRELAETTKSNADKNSANGQSEAFDTMGNSPWRNLRWTEEKRWDEITPGITTEKVVELLGPPPRSLQSLKPRVDEVFYYQTSLRNTPGSLFGKISFRKGKVLAVEKPNFN